jgi:hypothetical protein
VTLQTYFSHSGLVIYFFATPPIKLKRDNKYAKPKPFSSPKLVYCGFSSSNFTLQDHILSTSEDALMVVYLWLVLISRGTLKVLYFPLCWASLVDPSHQFCTNSGNSGNSGQFPMEVWWLSFGLPLWLCNLISACLPQIETSTEGKPPKKKVTYHSVNHGHLLLASWSFCNAYFALSTYLWLVMQLNKSH